MFSFGNTGALIVGAAGGIGHALALEFSKRGARLALADLDEPAVKRTAQQITDAGGEAIGIACDITDPESLENAVGNAERFLGNIDISVNAVGVLLSGNVEDIPLTEWERVFQINVLSAARLNSLLVPRMLAVGQGYIVHTASVAGLYPFASTRVPYAASKAALISMVQNMAIYLKPQGVRVSCLCPGPTITPIGNKITTWTEGVRMVGPGSDYALMVPGRTARIFCDGIEAEKVIILDQEPRALSHMQRWAASPDNFVCEKIGRYAFGDTGLPNIDFSDPEIAAALKDIDT